MNAQMILNNVLFWLRKAEVKGEQEAQALLDAIDHVKALVTQEANKLSQTVNKETQSNEKGPIPTQP